MNEPSDQRTIAELLVRYELEPTLQDIYVEGQTDRALIEFAVDGLTAISPVVAYEIGTVEVPSRIVRERDLLVGNKGRLLTLADELAKGSKRDLSASVICLVDEDLDGLRGRRRDYELLLYTSGLSLDAFLASEAILEKLFGIVLLGFPQSAGSLLDEMIPVLNERILQRVAADELSLSVSPPPLARSCTYEGSHLTFDANGYCRRFLTKAGAGGDEALFEETINKHRGAVAADPRRYFHVDDFVELLHFCIHEVKPRTLPELGKFRRMLYGLVEPGTIGGLREMDEVVRRFAVQPAP